MKKIFCIFACFAVLSLPIFASSFVLDHAKSNVDFTIVHLKLKDVNGKFKNFDGKIDFDVKAKKLNALSGEVEVASVDTANQKRDDHLRSDEIFNTAKFPKMTFVMTKYEEGKIYGDLTIKGTTKSVAFKAQNSFDGKVLNIKAETQVKRSDFGVVWESSLKDSLLDDELVIKLNLNAKEQK